VNTENKTLLTTDQVAKIHKVTRGSVIKWITDGHLKAKKFGRDYLVTKEEANSYVRRPITGRPMK